VTGQAKRIRLGNDLEALSAQRRDCLQRDQLVWAHIKERAAIDQKRSVQHTYASQQSQQLTLLLPDHVRPAFEPQKPVGP
jgi:hypothetical protein